MATVDPRTLSAQAVPEFGPIVGPSGWKRKLEDPFNTYYRYPVALLLTRILIRTPVTPNQVSLAQPFFAAGAGYCISTGVFSTQLLGVALFELRSILDCVDGSLARAKRCSSPNGHAIDAMADWLGVVLLYAGILWAIAKAPAAGYTAQAAVFVVLIALLQGAARSFSFDYFKTKYLGIFERGEDESSNALRDKVLALPTAKSPFAHVDVFIMRMGHLAFEGEWFRPETSSAKLSADEVERLRANQDGPLARAISFLWSISNGDAFLSFVMLSIVMDRLWAGQLFFASVGTLWIALVMFVNVRFVRAAREGRAAVSA